MSNANNNVIMQPPPLQTPFWPGAPQMDVMWAGWFNSLKMGNGGSSSPPAPGMWPQNVAPRWVCETPWGKVDGSNRAFRLSFAAQSSVNSMDPILLSNAAFLRTITNQLNSTGAGYLDSPADFQASGRNLTYQVAPAANKQHRVRYLAGGPNTPPIILGQVPFWTNPGVSNATWSAGGGFVSSGLPGDVVVVAFYFDYPPGAPPSVTVTDQLGNKYVPVITKNDPVAGNMAGLYMAQISTTGFPTSTNVSGGQLRPTVNVAGGVNTSMLFNWTLVSNTNGLLDGTPTSNANSLNPPGIITTGDNSLILVASFSPGPPAYAHYSQYADGTTIDGFTTVLNFDGQTGSTINGMVMAAAYYGAPFTPTLNTGSNAKYAFTMALQAQVD